MDSCNHTENLRILLLITVADTLSTIVLNTTNEDVSILNIAEINF